MDGICRSGTERVLLKAHSSFVQRFFGSSSPSQLALLPSLSAFPGFFTFLSWHAMFPVGSHAASHGGNTTLHHPSSTPSSGSVDTPLYLDCNACATFGFPRRTVGHWTLNTAKCGWPTTSWRFCCPTAVWSFYSAQFCLPCGFVVVMTWKTSNQHTSPIQNSTSTMSHHR